MNKILHGDALDQLKTLEDESVQMCVTSPPYWGLRDYGKDEQLGAEKTPEEFVNNLVAVFREIKRVLKKDGTLWLNLGDSYANTKVGNTEVIKNPKVVTSNFKKTIPQGLKPKDLVGTPWRVAFALQADGWYLRQDIIWSKPNPMPESVTDRCTKSHEYIFLLSKSQQYFYDHEAIKEKAKYVGITGMDENGFKDAALFNGKHKNLQEKGQPNHSMHSDRAKGKPDILHEMRNKRSVWDISTKPFSGAHFAVFPPEIPELCIKAGSKEGDTILDPFFGSGTTGWVAKKAGRKYLGIELNEEYIKIAEERLNQETLF